MTSLEKLQYEYRPSLKWKRYKVQAERRRERNQALKDGVIGAGITLALMNDWAYTADYVVKNFFK